MMSKTLGYTSNVTRQQVIMIDIPWGVVEDDIDTVVIEIPLMFGRVKRITLTPDQLKPADPNNW
jgi:hypothetical protein